MKPSASIHAFPRTFLAAFTFLCLLCTASELLPNEVPEPIAHWKANRTTEDAKGNAKIVGATAIEYGQGISGQAFQFDGKKSVIATDLDVQPSAMPESTWSCWINSTRGSPMERQQILSSDDGGLDRSVMLVPGFLSVFTGNIIWQVAGIERNEWTHVAVVWKPDAIVCYINGRPFHYQGTPGDQATIQRLFIGKNPSYPEFFYGLIDEVKIFDRALTGDQVQKLFAEHGGKPDSNHLNFSSDLPKSSVERLTSPVQLHSSKATIEGDQLVYEPQQQRLAFWRNTKDTATFEIPTLRAGTYTVSILYGADPRAGGGKLVTSWNGQDEVTTIRTTRSFQDYVDLDVGTFRHSGGPVKIVLRAGELASTSLMNMPSISIRDPGGVRPPAARSVPPVQEAPLAQAGRSMEPSVPSREERPTSGTLITPLPVELKRDGKAIGSMTLQPGTSVPIVRWDGTRALVKTAGGEVWVNTASEWEVSPIMEVDPEAIKRGSVKLGLTLRGRDPQVAVSIPEGLFFAERKAGGWEIEKIESWNADSQLSALHLGQGKNREPLIAYLGRSDVGNETEFDFLKATTRDKGDWQLSTLEKILSTPWSGSPLRPVVSGEFQGNNAVTTWCHHGGLPTLWTQENGDWNALDLHRLHFAQDESISGFHLPMYMFVSDILFAGENLCLLSWNNSPDANAPKPNFLGLYQFDGKEWKGDVIHSPKTEGEGGILAAHKEKFFVNYRLMVDDVEQQFVAQAGPSWEDLAFDGKSLGTISTLAASSASTVGFASGDLGEHGAPWVLRYSEKSFPGTLVVEEIARALGSVRHMRGINETTPLCALAYDDEGTPHILFVGEDGKLNLAARTRSAQLATAPPANCIFHLPESALTTKSLTITELPEKTRPGSETDWLQKRSERLAAIPEPETFTMEIAGHEAEIIRWGAGDKAVVFFSRMPTVDRFGDPELKYDHFGGSIAAQIDEYQSLLANGFSVITWRFTDAPSRIFSGVGRPLKEGETVDENRDLSGEATALVEVLREKTGIQEMFLVGDGSGYGKGALDLLSSDLAALEEQTGIRVILIGPLIPKEEAEIAKWPGRTKSTLIGSIPSEHWFSENPKSLEWVKDNRSAFTEELCPGNPRPSLGRDIPHETFASWLMENFPEGQ